MSDWLNEVYGWAREKMGGQKRLTPEQEYYRLHGEFPPPGMDPTVSIDAAEPDVTAYSVSEPDVKPLTDRPGGYSGPESPGLVAAKLDVQRREQAARPAPPEGLSVADAEEPFVGPVQPYGPEYRPELMKQQPAVASRPSSAPKATASTEAPQKQPFGPEYRPDLLNPEQSAAQPPVFAERAPQQPMPQTQPQESAPYDRSGWYAALRGIANAGGLAKTMGMEPSTAYYDTKIGQEQQKQKDWKDRLALQLKQKFEQEQQGREFGFKGTESDLERKFKGVEAGLDRDVRKEEAEARREDAKTAREQSERHFRITDQRAREFNENSRIDRQNTQDSIRFEHAKKEYPSRTEISSSKSLLQTLDAGRVPKGWSKFMTIVQTMSPEKLKDIETALYNAKLSPQEAKEVVDVWGAANPAIKRNSGGQVTASEWIRNAMQLGIGPGQGEEAAAYGLRRLAEDNLETARRAWEGQSEGVQRRMREGGMTPADYERPKPAPKSLLDQLKANGVE